MEAPAQDNSKGRRKRKEIVDEKVAMQAEEHGCLFFVGMGSGAAR